MPELQVVCLPAGRCLGQYEAEKASDGVWGSYLLCGRLFSVPYAGPSAARSCQTPEWWELPQGESRLVLFFKCKSPGLRGVMSA